MTGRPRTAGEEHFWELAGPLLGRPGVTRSTMMGFACLRFDGDFFATCDHRTGALVVKLDEERAADLVATGVAEAFAPAGRRFRAWAAIPVDRSARWPGLLDDALDRAVARRAAALAAPEGRRRKR